MAGFEVIIYGRFWVITEDPTSVRFVCLGTAVSAALSLVFEHSGVSTI
jgi:hypothetical protein